jgi:hypothetical protein
VTMFPPDDPRFFLEDDPRPPEPDTAVLQRVVARGRQRLVRRRALFGGAAVAVAAVLVTSGVAAAQHHSAGPNVQVQSPGGVAVDDSSTTTTLAPLQATPTTIGAAFPPPSTPVTTPQGQPCPSPCGALFPAPPGTQAATATAFVGEVKLSATEGTAGDSVGVELDVTNFTDHPVDVEGALGGPATAVVCTNDLTPDGHTNTPLSNENPDANIFWINAPVIASGGRAGIGPMTIETTAAQVGVVTCEAVLVRSPRDGVNLSDPGYIIARLSNIPAVTYTVLPAPDVTTTTTTITTDTSTTTPETTVPSP